MHTTTHAIQGSSGGSAWKGLYQVGGVAGLLAAIVFRRSLGAEVSLLHSMGIIRGGPAVVPVDAGDWYTLLQTRPLLGLTWLDTFDLVEYALLALLFLALFVALRQAAASTMVIATACGLVGVVVNFASNHAFSLLVLSDRYAGAATEAQKALYLAAGEALLAGHNPGAVFQGSGAYLGLFLVLTAGLLVSLAMARTCVFGKWAAWMGILANAFGLCYFLALAFAPALRFLPPSLSAPFRLAWYILIALRLFRLAKYR
jgi:hypothetical protein